MLNTSFCRCKAFLKVSQSALNTDVGRKIDLRCYTAKVIYSSESPHEKGLQSRNPSESPHEREYHPRNLSESLHERTHNPRNSTEEKGYNPRNVSGQHQSFEGRKFSQKEPYRKNYGHKGGSYEAKNKHRNLYQENELVKEKKYTPVQLFDKNFAFLDNTEKIRIKPKSPLEEDELKPGKLYRRNYKIADNPSYNSKLLYEENSKENDDIHSESDQKDFTSQDSSTRKLRKKYSFDSNLVFEKDENDDSPLKLDIINATSSIENVTERTVDTTNVNSSTHSNLTTTDLRPRYKTIDTPEGQITLNLADDEFDVKDFVKELNEQLPGPLDECTEDISYYGPDFSPTFNFAAYADKSTLIQQYVKLGVKLYKVEKNMDHMRALLSVDLENELPVYIQFLHDCGVPANCLGDAITENPMILKEDLDDMKTRIRYLRAHNFTPESIARIVTKNPSWLVWATKFIDERLGHFQNEFHLDGSDMRFLATKAPKLITYPMRHVNENTFAVREQMGFGKLETKLLLLYKPRLWMNNRRKILDSFDYLHNTMQLSHLTIASQADVMTTRKSRIKSRHEFLVELKKAQYDPKKPGYIAPRTMVVGSDADFCTNVAKTAVDTYNLFLKTR